ncbi:MAG: hypothetical protein AB1Z98_05820 [Nannocystaceae bacterium]
MTQSNLRYAFSLLCGAVLMTACPGDDSPSEVTTTGEDSTSTTNGMVTVNPTTITATDTTPMTSTDSGTTMVDPDTTVGPGESTTMVDPGTTTMVDPSATGSSSGSGSGSGSGGGFDCEDVDLGSMLPVAEVGSNVGGGDDYMASCAFMGGNDEDLLYEWTAPADGTYVFDTLGSDIDTILTLLSSCDGTEIDCNDDEPGGTLQSELTLDMVAGQAVLISVDGWNESGDFVLNINEAGGMGGSSSSGGSTSGGMSGFGFGDCDGGAACGVAGEVCFGDGPAMTVTICTFVGCAVAGDCTPPDPALGGTADIICADLNGDMVAEECGLDCSMGQTCPMGMDCFAGFLCAWPTGP